MKFREEQETFPSTTWERGIKATGTITRHRMNESSLPPPPFSPEINAAVDAALTRDRLKLLEIGYYIAGVLTIVGVSFLLIHFTLFLTLGLNPHIFDHTKGSNGHPAAPPPPGLFLVFAGVIGFIILFGWTFGSLQIYAGRCIRHRCHPLFILIIAGVECLFIPWGTFLGVCTFLVMERPSAKALFARG